MPRQVNIQVNTCFHSHSCRQLGRHTTWSSAHYSTTKDKRKPQSKVHDNLHRRPVILKCSFFPDWNNLDEDIVSAPTVPLFKKMFRNYHHWLLNWFLPVQHQCSNKAVLVYSCWSWSWSILHRRSPAMIVIANHRTTTVALYPSEDIATYISRPRSSMFNVEI